jgi:DNA-binding HxlR family transcriptional regulator
MNARLQLNDVMNPKKFNVYNENCPSRRVLDLISDKWTILIIEKLSERTYRFGELRREVGGISQKVLTQTLRSLEKNGFLLRQSYPVLPLRVEYSLTELGKSLSTIFKSITTWAEAHNDDILQT